MIRVRTFSSAAAAEMHLRELLIGAFTGFNKLDDTPYVTALAGGATPLAVYTAIAAAPPSRVAPGLHLLVGDDRHVRLDSPDSNSGHIARMAAALGVPAERLLGLNPTLSPEDAARALSNRIEALLSAGARRTLALLGVGTDGHTASLFEASTVLDQRRAGTPPYAVPVPKVAGFERVSVTAPVFDSFEHVIFFATGNAKREILTEIARTPERYPAGLLAIDHPNAEFWTDFRVPGATEISYTEPVSRSEAQADSASKAAPSRGTAPADTTNP